MGVPKNLSPINSKLERVHSMGPTKQNKNENWRRVSKKRNLERNGLPNDETIINSNGNEASVGRETTGTRLLVRFSELHWSIFITKWQMGWLVLLQVLNFTQKGVKLSEWWVTEQRNVVSRSGSGNPVSLSCCINSWEWDRQDFQIVLCITK